MSRTTKKTRNTAPTTAVTTAAADRRLHVVADADTPANGKHGTTAEDKVRTALRDNPGVTTATLALAAGVGRSTAAKILARWDRDGIVIRTEGEGQRAPDTWTISDPGTDGTEDDAAAPGTETADAAVSPTPEDGAPEDGPAVTGPDRDDDGTAAEEPTDVPRTEGGEDDGAAETGGDTIAEDTSGSQPAPAEAEAGERLVESGTDDKPTTVVLEKKERLGKGALRGMVEDYLAEHPGESFGPATIGKDLGRSGGAVNNALEKLVEDGYAIKTCEAPKRFRYKGETVTAD